MWEETVRKKEKNKKRKRKEGKKEITKCGLERGGEKEWKRKKKERVL